MNHDMEFVFRPEVQTLFDHFCSLHGIRIAFFSPEGIELRVGQDRSNGCSYCRLLRRELGYEHACLQLDADRRAEAQQLPGGLLSYPCHGGMIEAIMPVRVGGRLIGFAMIGQFTVCCVIPGAVLKRARSSSVRRKLQAAFDDVPKFPPESVRHILGLFEVIVRFIAEHHMIERKDVLAPILAHLRRNPEQRLTLTRAAAMAGRTPASLSHLFRRELKTSFQRCRIEGILDKADAYFRDVPGIRVKEVANLLGFDDPLYFSRLYRRHRGHPPSQRGVR